MRGYQVFQINLSANINRTEEFGISGIHTIGEVDWPDAIKLTVYDNEDAWSLSNIDHDILKIFFFDIHN